MAHYDPLIFDPKVTTKLVTPEQWGNYIEERFAEVVQLVSRDPGPQSAIINGRAYKAWERMLMISYGRCVEACVNAHVMGVIPPEQFQRYKRRFQFVMQKTAAEVQLGTR